VFLDTSQCALVESCGHAANHGSCWEEDWLTVAVIMVSDDRGLCVRVTPKQIVAIYNQT
jgi:hypothetical protein